MSSVLVAAVAVITVVALAAGCSFETRTGPAPGSPRSRIATASAAGLRAFDECAPVLRELQEVGARELSLSTVGPAMEDSAARSAPTSTASPQRFGAGEATSAGPAASPASGQGGDEWGGTNVQEVGIDEPDSVKTRDGLLITVVGGVLRIVDVGADEPVILGDAAVAPGAQLLVDGDTALVLSTGASGLATELTAYDVSDPSAPAVREVIEVDGYLVSARMVDGMVRVVTTTGGPTLDFVEPTSTRALETARRRNIDAIRASDIDDWLPRFRVRAADGRTTDERPMVGCADVYLTEQPSSTSMVTVTSVDLRAEALEATGGASVVGAGEIVYASTDSLYVTNTAFDAGNATDIHQFAIGGREPATYRASGRVQGSVLDQFALSERGGNLRVAVTTSGTALDMPSAAVREPAPAPTPAPVPVPTTIAPPSGTSSQSSVVVLGERDGELVEVGRVDGLGRGEQIRSVRFLDDVGYVVTFRQTDPLYTVDLADPTSPRVTGELKIPGYSSYLHPAGDGRLIGIGQDATEQGQVLGLQLALFDVSDPASPQQLAKRVLPGASSTAEGEHHAFGWWADHGLAVVPVTEFGASGPFDGAIGFSVSAEGIDERGRVTHDAERFTGVPIERSVIVDGHLVTLSAAGLSITDPATFSQLRWLAFD
jgi:uncharacterized secreted protein with C-terminal beta-propeller domain